MSQAIAVLHGAYGRAALYHLDRAISLHAHREGHLVFRIDGRKRPEYEDFEIGARSAELLEVWGSKEAIEGVAVWGSEGKGGSDTDEARRWVRVSRSSDAVAAIQSVWSR